MKVKTSIKLKRPLKIKNSRKLRRPLKLKRSPKTKRRLSIKPNINVKRPNAMIYFLAYSLVYPALKVFFRLKVERDGLEVPKGPYIVLSNHFTMLDFLLVMLSLYPHRLNAVTAQKWFLNKPLNKLLPIVGCIPKNMFDPDVRSIIGMKTVINRGDGLLLFPEGRCSSSHAYVGMHKSTGKMIKKFGVPVITCYLEGADICIPHWRKGFRSGRIRVTYKNLFSAEQTQSLCIDEINAAVDARLSGVEGALPVPANKPFKTFGSRKLAEGLHQVLYYCPKCSMEFTMVTEGNKIRCTSCDNEATMDRYAKLSPTQGSIAEKEISLWFRDQVRHEMKSLHEDMQPIVIERVRVMTPSPKPGDGVIDSGFGTLQIDPKGWHFSGEMFGERVSKFFPVETIPAISYEHNDNFQIYFAGDYYVFIPEDRRMCIKYVIIAEGMHYKFSPRVLMTPGINSGFI